MGKTVGPALYRFIRVLLSIALLGAALPAAPALAQVDPSTGGSSAKPAPTPTPSPTPSPTSIGACSLYPIALSIQSLAGVRVGGQIPTVYNGTQPGNFGWLTWTGDTSDSALAASLTPPGNSSTYTNPSDPSDHVVSVGDWVLGRPGVSNSPSVQSALNSLESLAIILPVWDQATQSGSNAQYHTSTFAQVQLTNYSLTGTDKFISATFLGYVACGGGTPGPTATSPTSTSTPTRMATSSATNTPTAAGTSTATQTASSTSTRTATNTTTPTFTPVPAATATTTPPWTPTSSSTPSNTPTLTPLPTLTPTGTATPSLTPVPTATPTNTGTSTPTNTATSTATSTATNTSTATWTPVPSATSTNTPTATVPACIPPPANLVGWYPGDGNTNDLAIGNQGILQGGADFAPGLVGQAFSLNGTTAYIQAANNSLQDPTQAATLDAWVYFSQLPSAAGHIMAIAAKSGAGQDLDLQAETDNRFHFYVANGQTVTSNTVVQTGRWYHVAGTYTANVNIQMYVNGALENTTAIGVTRQANGNPFTIGASAVWSGRYFNGLIDEVQMFSRALAASEVAAIFNAGSGGQCKPTPTPTPTATLTATVTPGPSPTPVAACAATATATPGPSAVTWVGGSSGFWDVAGNWSTGALPGSGNDVYINGAVTVTFRQNSSTVNSLHSQGALVLSGGTLTLNTTSEVANAFTLSGGTLVNNGSFTVSPEMDWTSGTLQGSGSTTIPACAALNISGSATKTLFTETVNSYGQTTWSGTGTISGIGGGVFNNQAGSLFDTQGDASFTWNGFSNATFNNYGTFRKSSGTGTTSFSNVPFNNYGTVTLSSGTVSVTAGSSTGAFTITSPASFTIPSGTYSFNSGTNLSGSGFLVVSGGTLTINSASTVQSLEVDGGTLNGSSALTVSGTFNWTGGTLSDAGSTTIAAGAQLNISGSATKTLFTRTIDNYGTTTWTGTGTISGIAGSTFNNQAGALFDAQSDASFAWNGFSLTTFNNSGEVRKSAGTGTTVLNESLNNSGTVNVQSGTLSLPFGETASSGAFNVLAGATLDFSAGTHNLNLGSSVSGAGTVRFSGATANLAGSYNVTGVTTIVGGTANFNGPATTTSASLSVGTLGGTGTLTVTQILTWTDSTMSGSGSTTIAARAQLNISGSATKTLFTRTINNYGTTTWTGTGMISAIGGMTFNNQAGALFDMQTDAAFNWNGFTGGTWNNYGEFRKSAGTGTTSFAGIPFNNYGTVNVLSGTFSPTGGGSSTAVFNVTAPAAIAFTTGTFTLYTGASIAGSGLATINGGTLTINGTASAQNLELDGGTLNGLGTLTVTGLLNWTGGTMSDGGVTTVAAGAQFNISGSGTKTLFTRTINNAGAATWTGTGTISGIGSGIVNNQAGGLFDLQSSSSFAWNGFTNAAFNNSGEVRKSSGTGASAFNGIPFTNNGTVNVLTGTLSFLEDYTQNSGSTNLTHSSLSSTGTVHINGGSLTGTGTVTGTVVSTGQVSPGAPIGVLTISGSYTQAGIGSLTANLGGRTVATEYSQLVVTGSTTLGGSVNPVLVNGFVPNTGDSFQVMTFPSASGAALGPATLSTGQPIETLTYATYVQITVIGPAGTPTPTVTPGPSPTPSPTPAYQFSGINVFLGYADNLRSNPNLPVPWQGSANTIFLGAGPSFDDGAIRLDNTTGSVISVQAVTVTLHSDSNGNPLPGQTFNLWGSFDIPAGDSAILAGYTIDNFDTSDFALAGFSCSNLAGPTDNPPKITISLSGGSGTTLLDTAHILDTGGVDYVNCVGNESLQWRPAGTVGLGNPSGSVNLSPVSGSASIGGLYTLVANVTDASGLAQPNVTVNFAIASGPNAGLSASTVTNGQGVATFVYSSQVLGTDTVHASVPNISGGNITSNSAMVTWALPSTATPTPTATHMPTITPMPTNTATASATPVASNTSPPSNTPVPTNTALPTATDTPAPTSTPMATPLPNDSFAGATSLAVPGSASGSTAGATLEPSEPQPCGSIGSTVWFQIVPAQSRTLTASSDGSAFDTVLALYSGSSLTGLTLLECNDDANSGTLTSYVSAAVSAGQTYYLQLGGFSGLSGNYSLQVAYATPTATPTSGPTASPSQTPTPKPTASPTPTSTVIRTPAGTATAAPTQTATATGGPSPTPPPPPSVALNASDGITITAQTSLTGTASSPALAYYTLAYRPTGTNLAFTTFFTGTTSVTGGTLGTFDPTLLMNGMYDIQLLAVDTFGQGTSTQIGAVVEGHLKVGNFSVSFNDATIPAAGFPIQVLRTYNSFDKGSGDFGVGWRLVLNTVDLQENDQQGMDWYGTATLINPVIYTIQYCLVPARNHIITITLSDGTVLRFQPVVTPQCQIDEPIMTGTLSYQALPGTNATLAPVGDATFLPAGSWPDIYTGSSSFLLVDQSSGQVKDFSQYQLTLQDGRVLTINLDGGLQSITDLAGNTLTIGPGGIVHSDGQGATFTRDSQGRITRITDPSGGSMSYAYDVNGNLASFTDRDGFTTSYSYDGSHDLVGMTDPRGVQPLRSTYDANGRLIASIDAFGHTVNYTHDLTNRQELITDRNGNVSVYEYDSHGNVVRKTDPLGNVTTDTYDAFDNKLSETDPLGHTTTFTYDAANNLTAVTDPLGNVTRYTYNASGEPLTITDPLGHVSTMTYDGHGNLTSVTDPAGDTSSFTYNSAGQRTSVTDPLGHTTSFTYDTSGNQSSTVDPTGHAVTFAYNADNYQTLVQTTKTDSLGHVSVLTRTTVLDAMNLLTQATFADGHGMSMTYSNIGKPSAMTDRNGQQTSFTYDAAGRRTQVTFPDGRSQTESYDANGNVTGVTDQMGRTSTMVYDALNRAIATHFADGSSTSQQYDAAGRVSAATDANGATTTYGYDADGRAITVTDALGGVTTFAYDAAGRKSSVTDPNGHTTHFVYDPADRLSQVLYPDGTSMSFAYDAANHKLSQTDQAGRTTRFAYDSLGRLVQVTDALGGITTNAYDEVGNLLSRTDANGHVTRSDYDVMGRASTMTLPLGISSTYSYDAAGRLASTTDFHGQTISLQYDVNNNVVAKVYPDGSKVTYTYTADGQNLASVTDSRGTTSLTYDANGRLSAVTNPDGSTLSYGYDVAGHRTSVTSPSGTTTYTYDLLGRLATVSDASGATRYAYDAAGNRTQLTYPNGVTAHYTYDSLNRLTKVENDAASGTAINSYTYTLDATGRRTAVVENTGRQVFYTYDALYRLTQEQIVDPVLGNQTIAYTYDAAGNRLTRSDGLGTTTFAYDANDRLLSAGALSFTYDANGNPLTAADGTNTTQYTYDYENRLSSIQAPGLTASYSYDDQGARVQSVVNGATTNYLVDENRGTSQVLEERDGSGNLQTRYTYGDQLLAQERGGTLSYYLDDGRGSTRALTDAGGNVTDTYTYDAFGTQLGSTGSTTNAYRYAGQSFDSSSGLYYLRARYYNPALGRFLNRDSLDGSPADPASLNRYSYAENDPVNGFDPSGHFDLLDVATAISIASVLSAISTGIFAAVTLYAQYKVIGDFLALGTSAFDAAHFGARMIGLSATISPSGVAQLAGCEAETAAEFGPIGAAACTFLRYGLALVSFTGGIDELAPQNKQNLFWVYVYVGVVFGGSADSFTNPAAVTLTPYFGYAWNTPDEGAYTGWTRSVGGSWTRLPQLRALVANQGTYTLFESPDTAPAAGGDYGVQIAPQSFNPSEGTLNLTGAWTYSWAIEDVISAISNVKLPPCPYCQPYPGGAF